MARPGKAQRGMAGEARRGTVWHGKARQARRGLARQGVVWRGRLGNEKTPGRTEGLIDR